MPNIIEENNCCFTLLFCYSDIFGVNMERKHIVMLTDDRLIFKTDVQITTVHYKRLTERDCVLIEHAISCHRQYLERCRVAIECSEHHAYHHEPYLQNELFTKNSTVSTISTLKAPNITMKS